MSDLAKSVNLLTSVSMVWTYSFMQHHDFFTSLVYSVERIVDERSPAVSWSG
jgi:hypothetical protein